MQYQWKFYYIRSWLPFSEYECFPASMSTTHDALIRGWLKVEPAHYVNSIFWVRNLISNRYAYLPPANEVWGKVICLQASVCARGGGVPDQVQPRDQVQPPSEQTPPGPGTPPLCSRQTPQTRYTPRADTPPGPGTPPHTPPGPMYSPLE